MPNRRAIEQRLTGAGRRGAETTRGAARARDDRGAGERAGGAGHRGSRGIGRAIALRLASEGADVAVNYRRDAEAAEAVVAEIRAGGRKASAFAASVDDPDQDAAMAEAVLASSAGWTSWCTSAGIASRGQRVTDTDPGEPYRLMATHTFAAHHLCRLLVPRCASGPGATWCCCPAWPAPTRWPTGALLDGQGRAGGAGRRAGPGGAAARDPRQRGGPGLVATDMAIGWRTRSPASPRPPTWTPRRRSGGCAGPRTSPTWWPSWSPRPTSAGSGSPSTAAAPPCVKAPVSGLRCHGNANHSRLPTAGP